MKCKSYLKKSINVGIIGMGAITDFYLKALSKNQFFNLVAVCDIDFNKINKYKGQIDLVTRDVNDVLNSKKVDAIIVNLPNDLHYKTCMKAIKKRIHVCCEKPLVKSRCQVKRLIKEAKKKNVVLQTAFHRRYNKNIYHLMKKMRNSINNHNYPISVKVRYLENIKEHCFENSWYLENTSSPVGAIFDNGPNAIDVVRYLVGDIEIYESYINHEIIGLETKAVIKARTQLIPEIEIQLDWEYQHGECKDVFVKFHDGKNCYCNMLSGFTKFKSSLFHEYIGVLNDFKKNIIQMKRIGSIENTYDISGQVVVEDISLVGSISKKTPRYPWGGNDAVAETQRE
ncbi:MAG: Gfo/Idh/MocA family oxidoreductase [Flavobacteriales bacterium]|nr:Gfo/Idh/MocA family oxidoreductase [Flavobacteriales bacterium]